MQISDSIFTENTRNPTHPAVWIHDYRGEKNSNRFSFINCRFEREGTVRFFRERKMVKNLKNMICSKGPFGECPDPLIELNNCTFTNSFYTALEICVKLFNHVQAKTTQNVSIIKCVFQHFKEKRKNSYASIVTIISRASLSTVAYTIAQNHFILNNMAAPVLLFHQLEGKYILSLSKIHFLNNFNSKNVIVQIRGHTIPIQKYDPGHTDVSISECIFRNNTSAKSKSILRVENIYLILKNSTFNLSTGTALYALQSFIQLNGFNSFTGNHGTLGGAINLNLSQIVVTNNSHTVIANNSALYGGGIYAVANLTNGPSFHAPCTIYGQHETNRASSRIALAGNKANYMAYIITSK